MYVADDVYSDELLMEFFEFYADFNFAEQGVSVITGSVVEKPDPSVPIYIENPLERELNVSKNVLEKDLGVFQAQCHVARDALKQSSRVPRSRQKGDLWGLLSILKTDDQMLLTEAAVPESPTVSDDDHVSATLSRDNVVDADQTPQRASLGVVDIHEILRVGDDDASDKFANNISTRTL